MFSRPSSRQLILAVLYLLLVAFVAVETVGVVVFTFIERSSPALIGIATIAQLFVVTSLRALFLGGFWRWGQPRHAININFRFTRLTAALIAVSVPMGLLLSNEFSVPTTYQPQIIRTLNYSIVHFGHSAGIIPTVMQYIYYVSEGLLIILLTDAYQSLAENRSRRPEFPWGGLGLALTWGLLHITTKGFATTIAAVLTGLAVGGVYLMARRSFWPPFALWMAITIV